MYVSTPLMTEDREDLKLNLAVESLRRRGEVRLRARGMSMLPSLWPGDLLTIQAVSQDEVTAGDIVLIMREKRCFIHRLVKLQIFENGVCLVTRGDAMPHCDPPAAAELLGRVIRVLRANRSFVPSLRISLVHSAAAWILCRSGCCRSLAMRFHAARLRGFGLIAWRSSDSYAQARRTLDVSVPPHP
jgi:hypothetical protein